MKVGLIADTHDRLSAVAELLRQLQEGGATMILHAGDFCAPFALLPFIDAGMPLLGVFGRNDGDHEGIRAIAQRGMGFELWESPHSFDVGGKRILLVHEIADATETSIGSHQIVVHGHTHKQEMKERDGALVICPGEACGWLHGSPGAALLDLDTNKVEFLQLPAAEWTR
ncbi:MAG: metallophosphoesterase [Gemmatimonadetes bacterium]|nr:metallophosphoesterase [Gemmatimonadota bacterium]